MTKASTEDAILKAQTGPTGEVFYIDGNANSRGSALDPASFAATVSGRRVRILASQENVELIIALYRRSRAAGNGIAVELGRPAGIDWAAHQTVGPRETLANIQQVDADRASLGGWHPMTDRDYPAYAMSAHIRAGGASNAALLELLDSHPAASAMAFIPHLDRGRLCRVIAAILDPRWYVDPDAPDRNAKLKCYLGLIPGRLHGASTGRFNRRQLVLATWKTDARPPKRAIEPGYFLWRHWSEDAGGAERADLRTSVRFIAYLKSVWLDGLLGDSWCPDGLFVPEYFFREPSTSVAWRKTVYRAPVIARVDRPPPPA